TAEEIDQLTVDEDLNDIERAVYLLSLGQEVQRASVISNLPSLVRQNPAETFRRVVPKVREVLQVAGADIQLAAAASFLTILQDDIVLIHTHTYSILKTVLLNLNHRDAVVSTAWLETLLSAINTLPKETIKQEVLNPLVYKSQLTQSVQARLASCRILGKVACKFDSHIVKKELLPLARSLCQDVEYEVRSCMCRQLENIGRGIGSEDSKAEVLPELVELAADEESSVRLAAFDTIINLMETIDSDDRVHVLVPLLMSVCEPSQADEAVVASLSFQYGKLCNGLSASLSDEQRARLLQRFKTLCVVGLQAEGSQTDSNEYTLIRCNCCFNLPAMIVFADSAHFLSELYPSFSSLCHDPEVSVRRSAAAGFHQVVKLLGSNVHLVHKELLVLLQDDSLEVLDALMNHLQETLEAMTSRGEAAPDNKLMFPELLAALLFAEQKVGSSLRWRLHEKLLQRYSCLARLLPGDLLHQTFSQRIFIILTTNKVLPVKKEAARTFCMFLRYNRKQEQRQEMMDRLIQDLAQGRSYWNRLRFLDVCETASELFSRKYFNKHFLIPALDLVHDPVANVRYKLCLLLPRLRSSIRLPADKQLLQQLDFCVQKLLCKEKDKDVVATIRKTVLELDKLDITEPYHKRQERDLLDQKREKEETLLLEMEQLERQQSEGKLNSEKLTERKRRDSKSSLSGAKSMSGSSSGATLSSSSSSSGKEMRKAKLSRSRSLSSQPTTSKPSNSDRPLKVKESGSATGPGKASMLPSNDDSLRTAHFTMATLSTTPSTSSMPVLIRSNTTSLLDRTSATLDHRTSTTLDRTSTTMDRTGTLDHRTGTLDHRTGTLDHRTGTLDHRTSTLDHRTGTLNHRTSTLDHRTSTLDQRSKTIDQRSSGAKDSQSRKLSINRKSNSFSAQSGRE
ncbi:LOW QUALITY PROTEIN: serine/threonine-protein phosphatase 4 regulatory subunit 4, partial [Centroberyx affinis]|uniref:LOW QUALITY PROTEIN: serine/threonine-protein phosphatase 4 regulatory subunit 4 n=1 Tax=Centroberyx affinis TaxID=166261 RepID=UPI003A5C3B47